MEEARTAPGKPADPARREGKRAFWRRPLVVVGGGLLLAGLFFYGLSYVLESYTHETTDDAFLDGPTVAMAPKVSGQVKAVHVDDNQFVQAGEVLFEIDPRDYQVEVEQRESAWKAAQANEEALRSELQLSRAQVAAAQASAKQSRAEADASQAIAQRAQSDYQRASQLAGDRTISPQELEKALAVAASAEADLRAAREKTASEEAKVAQAEAQVEGAQKAYLRGQAQTVQAEKNLGAAQLSLSYVRVTAPVAGRVTRKAVQRGDYLQTGQRVLVLVPSELWVTANFKETQLESIRTNQPVKIKIDSAGGAAFRGHVGSMQAGSGAWFSLLPPENAVGNYVKVVQRVPVKILFDEDPRVGHVLGPGMSVVPAVRVSEFTLPEAVLWAVAAGLAGLVAWFWWRAARKDPPPGD